MHSNIGRVEQFFFVLFLLCRLLFAWQIFCPHLFSYFFCSIPFSASACCQLAHFYRLRCFLAHSLFTFAGWHIERVVFGTFSTKHFTLFIFAAIACCCWLSSGFQAFGLSAGAQFRQRSVQQLCCIFNSVIQLIVYKFVKFC